MMVGQETTSNDNGTYTPNHSNNVTNILNSNNNTNNTTSYTNAINVKNHQYTYPNDPYSYQNRTWKVET